MKRKTRKKGIERGGVNRYVDVEVRVVTAVCVSDLSFLKLNRKVSSRRRELGSIAFLPINKCSRSNGEGEGGDGGSHV